jgi:cation diffusion facilitator CzcD-associated flavoprotein CzcO
MTDHPRETPVSHEAEHFDVLIVGAGISGIGGAYHLTQQCPDKTFVVLESQDGFGGTWRTHTYPGIRSDSDLYTFGYRFKPWVGAPIATAEEINHYLGEVIEENHLDKYIRYDHLITRASWSSDEKRWEIEARRGETGEIFRFTAKFLWMCQGYYRHSEGYTPEWEGMDDYEGVLVHPQTWPEYLDYAGKNVLVIGSGATAATIVPAMAPDVEHITMLQRSPTYFVVGRNANELADTLRELEIDEEWIHEIVRRKVLFDQANITRMSFEQPEVLREELFKGIRQYMGEDFDVDPHFNPSYRPWRQRIAFVPDGDLFQAVKSGKASVVTDHIERFTPRGVRLQSGQELEADIIVTATGFDISVFGDIDFTIDGEPLDFPNRVGYRGAMFTGIPNLAWVFGYFRASWTLRADLVADFVCRLLQHMDAKGADVVRPELRPEETDAERLPWVDPENFNPGYLMRSMHLLPKQLDHQPWVHSQDYWMERSEIPAADLDDGCLVFE